MSRPMERCHSYFYPRPPRGGRRGKKMVGVASNKFLSTPSARRATGKPRPWRRHKKFSIHALREEGDAINLDLAKFVLHFYPRPPRGGRLVAASAFTPLSNFYPRPPRGGRHAGNPSRPNAFYFYPRPPRGGRPSTSRPMASSTHFYPRPPRGGRRADKARHCQAGTISIHALREEGDSVAYIGEATGGEISIHALREEGDKRRPAVASQAPIFLSTPSARRATATVWPAWTAMLISIHALREEGDSQRLWLPP